MLWIVDAPLFEPTSAPGGFDRLTSASASDTPKQRKEAGVDAAPGSPTS